MEEAMAMSNAHKKRKAEDDLENEQRLTKRFDLLNLGRFNLVESSRPHD